MRMGWAREKKEREVFTRDLVASRCVSPFNSSRRDEPDMKSCALECVFGVWRGLVTRL